MTTVKALSIRIHENRVAWIEGTTTNVIEVVLAKTSEKLSPSAHA